jgi:hypothetical protein
VREEGGEEGEERVEARMRRQVQDQEEDHEDHEEAGEVAMVLSDNVLREVLVVIERAREALVREGMTIDGVRGALQYLRSAQNALVTCLTILAPHVNPHYYRGRFKPFFFAS